MKNTKVSVTTGSTVNGLELDELIIVCSNAQVIHAGAQIKQQVQGLEGIFLDGSAFCLNNPDQAAWLRSVYDIAARPDINPLGHLFAPNESGGIQWVATILPSHCIGIKPPSAGNVVLIRSLAMNPGLRSRQALRTVFGFTQAEAAIVERLIDGEVLGDIASQRRVSVQTLRQQLKVLFQKTGSHSQHQLVAKVLREPAIRYQELVSHSFAIPA